jgi:hypothetical protein
VCPLVVELVFGGGRHSLITLSWFDYRVCSKWRLQLALAGLERRIKQGRLKEK